MYNSIYARYRCIYADILSVSLGWSTLETTQGQIDGFFSQPPFKCYLPEVASMGD